METAEINIGKAIRYPFHSRSSFHLENGINRRRFRRVARTGYIGSRSNYGFGVECNREQRGAYPGEKEGKR